MSCLLLLEIVDKRLLFYCDCLKRFSDCTFPTLIHSLHNDKSDKSIAKKIWLRAFFWQVKNRYVPIMLLEE